MKGKRGEKKSKKRKCRRRGEEEVRGEKDIH